ncbi:NAD-dependent epimerase/dehydratase family protein [Ancylobacter defluvii]|uniref:NAD(P)-dependent oxidoreductase n=1 Tax=Ancylobacter defluvii TaxID=1282440 RepID=A0A9W6JVW8_9HYPH|nr:NAD-dependent epimerase/dehydratase family protein [Ancylobacter defluvii]GLK83279.1 NAD(P)-dependent oxidoreductase [Ancylobacter defluvii]
MTTLICLGYGFCARGYAALFAGRFSRVLGTSRQGAGAQGPVERLAPDSPALAAAISGEAAVLASAAPGEAGDPFLPALAGALEQGSGPIVYLSTIGVYGDSAGAWIDESAPLDAGKPRASRRIEAEAAWRALGARAGRPVAILRLGGIYGPGRNALVDVADGSARCIERAGQMFNRIHVDDIARTVDAAFRLGFEGAVNVVDDEPAPACAPVRHAARLLGRPEPVAVPFAQAAPAMSAMALSFWADNRRVRNARLRRELGVDLAFPSYREGLDALFAQGEGSAGARD